MKKTDAGSWCAVCWHCIVWDRAERRWLHVSNDDWSGESCRCSFALSACSPNPVIPVTLPERKRACGPTVSMAAEVPAAPGDGFASAVLEYLAACLRLAGIAPYAGGNDRQQEKQ
jgi:hypothetical protein